MTQSIQSVWARAFAMSVLFPAAAWAQSTTPAVAQSTQTPPIDRYVVGQAKPPDVPGTIQQDLTLEEVARLARIPDPNRAHREIRAAVEALGDVMTRRGSQ